MSEAKRNVTDTVYEQLMRKIVQGELKPGDRLPPENELKDEYQVSRNTIRTVLNRLNVLGVLETRRGEGTFIRCIGTERHIDTFIPAILINTENLLEILEFRRGIEVRSAALAALNAQPEDIEQLRHCVNSVRDTIGMSNEDVARTSFDFHIAVARASHNEVFGMLMDLIRYILTERIAQFLQFERNLVDSRFYHDIIFRCIEGKKPEEASFMMDKHMAHLIADVTKYADSIKQSV